MPEINKKLVNAVIVLLVLFLGVKTLDAFKDWRNPGNDPRTIVVNGMGEAFANPDVANFSFTVSDDADTVATAQASVSDKSDAIVSALREMGIEERDVRTTDYSVYPKYTYEQRICTPGYYCDPGRQIPDGFTVSQTLSIKVRKIDDAGAALTRAGELGATSISSLMFVLDDPDAVTNEARDKAVEQAREKAEILADSLGVRLGRVVDFSDNTYTPWPYPAYARAEMGGAADMAVTSQSLPVGENKITSNVTVTYEIR